MASILQFPDRGYSSSIILGTTPEGNPIQVTQDELCSGCYILGVQGSGKSSLLEQIIYEQMKHDECIIVFDPKGGDLIRNVIARMPENRLRNTYLLDLTDKEYPFSFNPFACKDPNSEEERRKVKNSVLRAFAKIWPEVGRGQYFDEVLYPLVETFIEYPELTMSHAITFLFDDTLRNKYVRTLRSRKTKAYWQDEYNNLTEHNKQERRNPLVGRVRKLLRDEVMENILCQRENRTDVRKIDFREAIQEKRIILINLPLDVPGYELAAPIIGTFLLSAIYGAAFSFADMPEGERPGFTLVVDEFDNFATSDYERFFTKARSFKVKQFLAHQYRHQLDREGMGTNKQATLSAHTVIGMKTTPEDAKDTRGIAGKFEGLKRRPTDIYIDVLDRLKTRRNPLVKEFYLHTVTSLQTASKMKIGTTEDRYGRKINVLPQFDFGFGTVSFDPENVTLVLTELNNLFYYSQKEVAINEARKLSFIKAYGKICGFDYTTELTDEWAIQGMIAISKLKQADIQRELRVLKKKLDESSEGCFDEYKKEKQAKPRRESECKKRFEEEIAINEKEEKAEIERLEYRIRNLKQELEGLYQRNFSEKERDILAFCDKKIQKLGELIKSHVYPRKEDGRVYYNSPIEFFPVEDKVRGYIKYVESHHKFDSFWEKLSNQELKLARDKKFWNEYIRLCNIRQSLNLIQKQKDIDELENNLVHRKQYHQELHRKNRQAEEEYNRALAEIEKSLEYKMFDIKFSEEHDRLSHKKEEMEKEERELGEKITQMEKEQKFVERINETFIPVIEALIKDPIASDKPPEIDEILINLKQRHALVNKGSAIYEMETIDLNNGKREEEEKKRLKHVYDSHIGSIRERTRSIYCRSRKVVEQQIYNLPDTKVTPQDDTIEIEDEEEEETKRLQQKYRELLNKPPTSQENTRKEKPEDSKSKNTEDDVDWQPYEED